MWYPRIQFQCAYNKHPMYRSSSPIYPKFRKCPPSASGPQYPAAHLRPAPITGDHLRVYRVYRQPVRWAR